MTTWDERMASRPPAPAPRADRIATLFRGRMIGGTGRILRCAAYRVETGLELRVEYEDNEDLLRSQLLRDREAETFAELAETWFRALATKGFTELPVSLGTRRV